MGNKDILKEEKRPFYLIRIDSNSFETLDENEQVLCCNRITNKYSCQYVHDLLRDKNFNDKRFIFYLLKTRC